jgi:dCTP deaminase
MAFWSTEKFTRRQGGLGIVSPYDPNNFKHGAYQLAVGSEAFITANAVKTSLNDTDQLNIPSGQFGLLLTEEVVSIPSDAIGFISIRASIKFQGLINVSGFHVDPGFTGRLKFAVYNAGSRDIALERGEQIFLLWLSDLDCDTTDLYNGSKQNQRGISADDVRRLRGDIASPAVLDAKIEALKHEVTTMKNILLGIFLAVLASWLAVLGPCIKDAYVSRQATTVPTSTRPTLSQPAYPVAPQAARTAPSATTTALPLQPRPQIKHP